MVSAKENRRETVLSLARKTARTIVFPYHRRLYFESLEERRLLAALGDTLGSLFPIVTASGLVSLSVDGLGTNDIAGGIIQVNKPSAVAKVKSAFLFAASTGFIDYKLTDHDVSIDGASVAWNGLGSPVESNIKSQNVYADITTLVKSKIDAAAPGLIDFLVKEGEVTEKIDGEILAVIFDDPNQTTQNTVILLFGALDPQGDAFNLVLSKPIDKSTAALALDMSLGISFGDQPGGQFSQIDVNGQRLTTSAGGQDDGEEGNGALLTVGGIGDTNDNPPNPLQDDSLGARYDDELYSLLPFVKDGDQAISVKTLNSSNDDNVFFAGFNLKGVSAEIEHGDSGVAHLSLTPQATGRLINASQTLTAHVEDEANQPLVGVRVDFNISGANAQSGFALTNSKGDAVYTYVGGNIGVDNIVVSAADLIAKGTITWLPLNAPTLVQIDPRPPINPPPIALIDPSPYLPAAIPYFLTITHDFLPQYGGAADIVVIGPPRPMPAGIEHATVARGHAAIAEEKHQARDIALVQFQTDIPSSDIFEASDADADQEAAPKLARLRALPIPEPPVGGDIAEERANFFARWPFLASAAAVMALGSMVVLRETRRRRQRKAALSRTTGAVDDKVSWIEPKQFKPLDSP